MQYDVSVSQHSYWLRDQYHLRTTESYKRAPLGKADLRLILEALLEGKSVMSFRVVNSADRER